MATAISSPICLAIVYTNVIVSSDDDVIRWLRLGRRQSGQGQKHGVSIATIEGLFAGPLAILPDPGHSSREVRLKAIGHAPEGRMVFLVFTERRRGGRLVIRPISARYMHAKEIRAYEKAIAQTDQ